MVNKYSVVAEMGDLLATIDMGRRLCGCAGAPFLGELHGPRVTHCAWAEAYIFVPNRQSERKSREDTAPNRRRHAQNRLDDQLAKTISKLPIFEGSEDEDKDMI